MSLIVGVESKIGSQLFSGDCCCCDAPQAHGRQFACRLVEQANAISQSQSSPAPCPMPPHASRQDLCFARACTACISCTAGTAGTARSLKPQAWLRAPGNLSILVWVIVPRQSTVRKTTTVASSDNLSIGTSMGLHAVHSRSTRCTIVLVSLTTTTAARRRQNSFPGTFVCVVPRCLPPLPPYTLMLLRPPWLPSWTNEIICTRKTLSF